MPIINPWIFYLTELLSYIDSVLNALIVIIMSALIILIVTYSFDFYYQDDDESKLVKKWIKKGIIGIIIIGLFAGIIPSKKNDVSDVSSKLCNI